jgi:predicted nucleic acid-binding protein
MVDAFIDTAILVDVLRGYAPAGAWLETQRGKILGITPLVWMELIDGAPNKRAQSDAGRLLSEFDMVLLTPSDMDWAMQQLALFRLSHGVGPFDCLIAAPSFRLRVPLFTHNLKHMTPILGGLAQKPY